MTDATKLASIIIWRGPNFLRKGKVFVKDQATVASRLGGAE